MLRWAMVFEENLTELSPIIRHHGHSTMEHGHNTLYKCLAIVTLAPTTHECKMLLAVHLMWQRSTSLAHENEHNIGEVVKQVDWVYIWLTLIICNNKGFEFGHHTWASYCFWRRDFEEVTHDWATEIKMVMKLMLVLSTKEKYHLPQHACDMVRIDKVFVQDKNMVVGLY